MDSIGRRDPSQDGDIAEEWQQALDEFQQDLKKKHSGQTLIVGQISSMEDAMQFSQAQQQSMKYFRHDQGKVDKVRTAFSNNIGLIQKVVTGAQQIASAAGAFPPAMPVAPIMTAFAYVFQTFRDASADYDRVMGFFDDMRAFLDRISMLEGHKPNLAPLNRCLREVFTSMFSICGIAADYKDQKRFKKWLHNLKDGSGDPELTAAYSRMDKGIQRLSEAVGIATFRTVSVVAEKVTSVKGDTTAIREGVESVQIGMDGMTKTIMTFGEAIRSDLSKKIDETLKQSKPRAGETGKSKQGKGPNDRGDTSAKKHKALSVVKRHFSDVAEVQKKVKAQRQDISESFVEGTGAWVFEDEAFQAWLSGSQRLAWLSGAAGLGKTFLAYATVSYLEDLYRDHTASSVAYFYFREEDESLRTFRDALRCIALQIAEQDTRYCEQVAADITRNSDGEPWEQFFASRYPAKSDSRLYLVLDGIDEALEDDKILMIGLFQQIAQEELNVHVIFTGRSELKSDLSKTTQTTIEVSLPRVAPDMQRLIDARCQPKSPRALPRLRKFRHRTRVLIRDKIMRTADGMLYVEHMLRRLNSIGREGAVLRDIDKNMPDTMTGLYGLMLTECQRGRTHDQYVVLKTLFAMLAYSKRALTLVEAGHLVRLFDPGNTFDIEDEIIGRSARILDTRQNDEDEAEDAANPSSVNGDHTEQDSDQDTDYTPEAPITFQDRSLREYFRSISIEEDGLRTPASLAQLTIFELIVKVLCNEEDAETQKQHEQPLRDYAANYWAHHFVSIDRSQLTGETEARVLVGLSNILGNKNNTSGTFEKHEVDSYVVLDEQTHFIERLNDYIINVGEPAHRLLDTDTRNWVEGLKDQPSKATLALAQGHVENWLKVTRSAEALVCFDRAKEALSLAGVETVRQENSRDQVLAVSKYFPDLERNPETLLSVSLALLCFECNDEAIEYSEKFIASRNESDRSSFYAHWIISNAKYSIAVGLPNEAPDEPSADEKCNPENVDGPVEESEHGIISNGTISAGDRDDNAQHEQIDQPDKHNQLSSTVDAGAKVKPWKPVYEEAIQHIQAALSDLPEGWKDDPKLLKDPESVAAILQQRALCERYLERPTDAISSYTESGKVVPLTGWDLDEVTRVRTWDEEPKAYMDLLRSWSPKQRIAWFEYLFDFKDGFSIETLNRYSKLSGQESQQFVIQSYEDYIGSLKRDSAKRVQPQTSLARYYWLVVGDNEKASEIYSKTLDMELSHDAVDGLDELLLAARLRLSERLFISFRACADPARKEQLLEDMKKLLSAHIGQRPNTDFPESQSALMLAIMTRTCGKANEYYEMLQKSFQTCVDGLSDSVGWNDLDSLRMLAKVLALVPGLARDAQIALSCQFSITDPNVEHGAAESSASGEDGDGAKNDGADGEEQPSGSNEPPPEQSGDAIDAAQPAESSTQLAPNADVEAIIAPSPGTEEEKPDAADDVGDLIPMAEYLGVGCDGDCDTSLCSWSQPMYLCIHCANCDLCESCYQKRKAMDKGEPCTYWRSWCEQDHRHIKGPIEGWRGIKNGVMRIGAEEVPFKEWLETLSTVRWKKAWEDFWRNESFVIDVGM